MIAEGLRFEPAIEQNQINPSKIIFLQQLSLMKQSEALSVAKGECELKKKNIAKNARMAEWSKAADLRPAT